MEDHSLRSTTSMDRQEMSESGVMYEMEHHRSQSMTDVPIPEEKEKSKKLSSRVARGVKKAIKGSSSEHNKKSHHHHHQTRSLSPPQSSNRQRQHIDGSLSSSGEGVEDLTLTPIGERKKKHKNKFKPVAKAAAAAARKISGTKKPSNRDRTQSEGSSNPSLGEASSNSRSSTPTNVQHHHHQLHPPTLPMLGKTPVNTPVHATTILDRPIPEELMEECSSSLANMKASLTADTSESSATNNDPSQQSQPMQDMSMEFPVPPTSSIVTTTTNNNNNTEGGVVSPADADEMISAEDQALKLAEAMALAVKDNPNMSHEDIRKMVLNSQPEFQNMQQQSTTTATPSASGSNSTKTLLKKNFMSFQTKFTSGTTTARDKFKELGSNALDLGGSVTSFVYSKATPTAATPQETITEGAAAATSSSLENSFSSAMQNSYGSIGASSLPPLVIPEQKEASAQAPTPAPPTLPPPDLMAEKPIKPASAESLASTTPAAEPPASTTEIKPPHPPVSPNRVVTAINSSDPPIRLTDIVWKRRSGLGKYSSSSAWERRRMVLRGSKLLYYRAQGEGDMPPADDSTGAMEGDLSIDASNASAKAGRSMMDALERAGNSLGISSAAMPTYQISASKADARGYMDLVKEGATVSATTGHSGAPSPFCLSIKVRGETKWKLCFASHKTQMEWLAALTDVAIQASVDAYNAELLSAADPGNPGLASALYHNQVFEPPGEGGEGKSPKSAAQVIPELDNSLPQPKLQSSGHRLWMMEPYNILGQTNQNEDDDSSTTSIDSGTDESEVSIDELAATRQMVAGGDGSFDASFQNAVAELEDVEKAWVLPEKNIAKAAILMNAAILYSRNSSMSVQGFWTVVVIANMCLFVCLEAIQTPGAQNSTSASGGGRMSRLGLRSRGIRKKKGKKGGAGGGGGSGSGGGASNKGATGGAKAKSEGFIPSAGMSTLRIENVHDLATNARGQVFAGWRAPTGADIHVRSHGYMKTKAKIPSPGTLYELNQMDVFESPARYPDMAPRVKLPKLTYEIDPNETKTWKAPDYFVVSVALPTDPPKLGGTSSDGGGYTLTMYFTMKKETRDVLKRVTAEDYIPGDEPAPGDKNKSIVNAVRLFEEWCRRAPNDLPFQTRFKMIPYVENAKEIGLPSWIGKYNAKPLLIKRPGQTGFLFLHPELSCIEFDISLHVFPYLAKQGICYLKDSMFKKILASVAFVIEGRDDDELPECLIGIVQICYPDPTIAIQANEFFAGTAPRSYDEPKEVAPEKVSAGTAIAAETRASAQPVTAL